MTLIQALLQNAGSLNSMLKGKLKQNMSARQLPMIVKVADETVVVKKLL